MPKRVRHVRRLQAIARALLTVPLPIKGVELCRIAGIEGPHRDPVLADALDAKIIRAVHESGLNHRPLSAKHYVPVITPGTMAHR